MNSLADAKFSRRPISDDGTVSSTCNKCGVTVAISYWKFELDRAEEAHVCDPPILERYEADLDENPSCYPDQGS